MMTDTEWHLAIKRFLTVRQALITLHGIPAGGVVWNRGTEIFQWTLPKSGKWAFPAATFLSVDWSITEYLKTCRDIVEEELQTEEERLQKLSEDALDSLVQDAYGTFRQNIGDFKLDNHMWYMHQERLDSFAAYLRMLADRVESRKSRRV